MSTLQIKHRLAFFYVERGEVTVVDGCLVLTDLEDNAIYQVPARATTTLLMGPGSTISQTAIRLASSYGILVQWVGEQGVRCYSAGRPWTEHTQWLDRQVRLYASESGTLKMARAMFAKRFGASLRNRSIEQLRGIEGARVKELYKLHAKQHRIRWKGRRYLPGNPDGKTDAPNLALNVANTCLYGLAECAVHATGTSPALGFIHRGSQLSFVLDIADLYKFDVAVPVAFSQVARHGEPDGKPWPGLERDVRLACRDRFRENRLLDRIVNDLTGLLDAADSA